MIALTISFARHLLVSKFSCVTINAFNPTTGALLGTLDGRDGKHLWALTVGNGSAHGGSSFDVYFTSDLVDEAGGLFGSLAVPSRRPR